MKKAILPALILFMIPLFLIPLIFGDNGGTNVPLTIIATPDKAWSYQYVGSELGIPWDITMLCDAIREKAEGNDNIEDENPLITALEFCILQEDVYMLKEIDNEDNADDENDGNTEDEDDEEIKTEWQLEETILYMGCDEILAYIERDRNSLEYTDAADIVVAINETAEKKCTANLKYDVTLLANQDYFYVLQSYIGLDEATAKGVIELYEGLYLPELYGWLPPKEEYEKINVPTVTSGVTRADLARVAVSLMNWEYLLGAKSPYAGSPVGALDCSGYVDWVYIQCFGIGVSAGGRVPAGVAVSGTAIQFYASDPITESELKIGDLGFLKDPRSVKANESNHVGIYIGEINGKHAWIHCGGKYYGYEERPNGRVGISINHGTNDYNPVTGNTFSPAMNGCNFKYFRRPRFTFADDYEEEEE